MIDPMSLALVATGGAAGGLARVSLAGLVARRLGADFPWGTLVVNLTGAFLIGLAAGMASPLDDERLWQLGVIGFLGSYTTVSSFSLQTLTLIHAGHTGRAMANTSLSIGLGLSVATLGFWMTQ